MDCGHAREMSFESPRQLSVAQRGQIIAAWYQTWSNKYANAQVCSEVLDESPRVEAVYLTEGFTWNK